MEFLSEHLVSSEYVDRLNHDLRQANILRFLVGFISSSGLNRLSQLDLIRALQHPKSFGVGSLTCACGYEPLLQLQREIGDDIPHLKYFMDPLVRGGEEPDGITLFHSKVAYLHLPIHNKSVIYIGSHNWTERAFGTGDLRNAEASLRIELDYSDDHLLGIGDSFPAQVNRHLLAAYDLPACLPATLQFEAAFDQWYQKGCRPTPPSEMEKTTFILCVQHGSTGGTVADWTDLRSRGLYLQLRTEVEGQLIRKSPDWIVVLIWESPSDLQEGQSPIFLLCRASTQNAGPDSELRGTNRARSPIAGFGAAIYDSLCSDENAEDALIPIWSGETLQTFRFEFQPEDIQSEQIDGETRPRYQFHLEVVEIYFPEGRESQDESIQIWVPESLAVAAKQADFKLERVEGYYVEPDLAWRISECLVEDFGVDARRAKVLPALDVDVAKAGKRFADHPLHDAFLAAR